MAKNKKVNKNKQMSKARVEKIARQVAYKNIPKKIDYNQGTDISVQNNSQPWLVIQPAFIDYGVNNNQRAGDEVFIEKCSGFFNVSFSTSTLNRVEVRELVGFYKGSTNILDKNIANFGNTDLNSLLPNKMSSWDRDNFYIKHDKAYDLMPHQIYEVSPGQPAACWKSKRIPLTQYLYRRFRYTNSVQGGDGDSVEGTPAASNHPCGWKPFIALQIRCPDQNFTGTGGSNAGPYVDYKFRTMFKDIH